MSKLTLNDLASLANQTTAIALVNSNNTLIEAALENTLSRDGTSPNTMGANLDMNSHRITNAIIVLASSNPHVNGAIWNNAGTIAVSTG